MGCPPGDGRDRPGRSDHHRPSCDANHKGLTFRSQDTLQDTELIQTRSNDLADRRSAAAGAKAALLDAFRARMAVAEPTRLARQEERRAISAARDERQAERDRLKRELQEQEQRRVDAEAAERLAVVEALAQAERERRSRLDGLIARTLQDEALRKAERDRRYANRKARQK